MEAGLLLASAAVGEHGLSPDSRPSRLVAVSHAPTSPCPSKSTTNSSTVSYSKTYRSGYTEFAFRFRLPGTHYDRVFVYGTCAARSARSQNLPRLEPLSLHSPASWRDSSSTGPVPRAPAVPPPRTLQ